MKKRPLLIITFAILLLITFALTPIMASEQDKAGSEPMSGAIWTTDVEGNAVNENVGYATKKDVYINGGPKKEQQKGLPGGPYYIRVTDPSGNTVLGTSKGTFTVTDGAFTELIQLFSNLTTPSGQQGYDNTPNPGGEYKVWVSQDPEFPPNMSKTDNFKVRLTDETNPPDSPPDDPPDDPPDNPPDNPPDDPPDNPPDNPPVNPPTNPPVTEQNNGGVTPPPSETVTPQQVKVIPTRVPSGDPTITVFSKEKLQAVYAILPDGRKLDLNYNGTIGAWQVSFLVPFGTPDGPYQVSVYAVNLQNESRQYNYTIIIDNSLPLVILDTSSMNKRLLVKAQVLFPAVEVKVSLAGNTFGLVRQAGSDKWLGSFYLPAALAPGRYTGSVTADDGLGHKAASKFVLQTRKGAEPKIYFEASNEEKSLAKALFLQSLPINAGAPGGLYKIMQQ